MAAKRKAKSAEEKRQLNEVIEGVDFEIFQN
jgi:hypothetical protein